MKTIKKLLAALMLASALCTDARAADAPRGAGGSGKGGHILGESRPCIGRHTLGIEILAPDTIRTTVTTSNADSTPGKPVMSGYPYQWASMCQPVSDDGVSTLKLTFETGDCMACVGLATMTPPGEEATLAQIAPEEKKVWNVYLITGGRFNGTAARECLPDWVAVQVGDIVTLTYTAATRRLEVTVQKPGADPRTWLVAENVHSTVMPLHFIITFLSPGSTVKFLSASV